MFSAQNIDMDMTYSGRDVRAPEVKAFGYCDLGRAIRTGDAWEVHKGIEAIILLKGEACWEVEDGPSMRAKGRQVVYFPAGCRHRLAGVVDLISTFVENFCPESRDEIMGSNAIRAYGLELTGTGSD